MDCKIVPKVFGLIYEISEEDHGLICVFSSYELAKLAKVYAEKEAKSCNRFMRFYIDVYEVSQCIPSSTIDSYIHFGFKIDNLGKD